MATPKGLPTIDLLTPQTIPKFVKPLSETPVHVDFPRLFTRIRIFNRDEILWQKDDANRVLDDMLEFFLLLGGLLGLDTDIISKLYSEKFPTELSETRNELPNVLKEFLNAIGDDSGIVGILKCCTQAIIVPAVMIIKVTFMSAALNYFEIGGKWQIDIKFYDDYILVNHERWERTSPDLFHFSWVLSLKLGRTAKSLQDTDLFISEIRYIIEDVDESKKLKVRDQLKQLYK